MSSQNVSAAQAELQQTQTQTVVETPVTRALPNKRSAKREARPVQKSADAFRTISEVADELRVEQHVLRFWETKFSQIKPLKRGGGRRYYRPEDVELIRNVHHLLYNEGYTIKGVQKLLSATRGNLSVRMQQVAAPSSQPIVVETPVVAEAPSLSKAVAKNKAELQSMLDELKSMRRLIG